MTVNVEVTKGSNENNAGILRRFTRRMQDSGVLSRVRSLRYASRDLSPYTRKKKRLIQIAKRQEVDKQIKLGKLTENPRRRRR